jgi:hypothetical protein
MDLPYVELGPAQEAHMDAKLLLETVNEAVGQGNRFAIVIWEPGSDLPEFVGSNNRNVQVAVHMLAVGAYLASEGEHQFSLDPCTHEKNPRPH